MEFKFYCVLAFLSVALVASHAALPSEVYWNSVLPNSPMPNAVKNLIHPEEWVEDKSTEVGVSKGGVSVNTGKGKPGGTSVNVGKGGGVNVGVGGKGGGVNVGVGGKGDGVSVGVGKGSGVNVGVGGKGGGVSVGVGKGSGVNVGVGGKGGVNVGVGGKGGSKKGRPVYVGVHPGPNPFNYLYAATDTQLHDNPNAALFFLEKDLTAGKRMNLNFQENTNKATFLPRTVADSIPFSSDKLPEIYSEFSVNPSSDEAEIIKKTIKECEETGIKGEEKFCATSLESMIDFSTSKIGKNVEAISTDAENQSTMETYSIVGVKKMNSEEKAVVACHRQEYAYTVFYCHKTETTVAYKVSLVAADGSKAEAVAACHQDTAAWNPKHLAFQVLKVKPGSVPVCHFLPQDHIVWVPKN